MGGLVELFGGVLVFGGVAAADLAAHHAHTEVNPGVAEFDALFTDVRIGARDLNLGQMFAFLDHSRLLQFFRRLRADPESVSRALSPVRGFVTSHLPPTAYQAAENVLPPVKERSSAAEAGLIRRAYGTSRTRALPVCARIRDFQHPVTSLRQAQGR